MDDARKIEFRFLAEPTHVNFGGKVHGGMVMKWMDQAAYACASQWTQHYCVTISVGSIRFYRPIKVGQMVIIKAKVVYTGNTSLCVQLTVKASDTTSLEVYDTNHCIMTFVAVDDDGKPVSVPKWTATTDIDKALEAYAMKLRQVINETERELLDVLDQQKEE